MNEQSPAGVHDIIDWLHEQGKRRAEAVPEFDVETTLSRVRSARDADAHARTTSAEAAVVSGSSGRPAQAPFREGGETSRPGRLQTPELADHQPSGKRDRRSSAEPARIFISYRHDDADWPVLWLTRELTEHLGPAAVFQDTRSIRPGDDFAAKIAAGTEGCSALLAVIGPRWLGPQPDGSRHIDNPGDWVRVEIETAISRGIRVIPVLVNGAKMPPAAELPESLQGLARKQTVELNPGSPDTRRLVSVLENALMQEETAQQ